MTSTITIKDPKAPASQAQLGYLDSLVLQRNHPVVCERYVLLKGLGVVTKGQASEWINQLLAAPKKTATVASTTITAQQIANAFDVPLAAVAPEMVQPTLTSLPSFGYYVQTDGTLLYWDVTGKDQFPTLRRLTVITNNDGTKKGKWSKVYGGYNGLKVTGTWIPYAGKGYNKSEVTKLVTIPKALVDVVTGGIAPLSQEAAGKLGKQFGFCVRCGATLTDPISVSAGLGPVCQKYWA